MPSCKQAIGLFMIALALLAALPRLNPRAITTRPALH
jgi:hypothetical protein